MTTSDEQSAARSRAASRSYRTVVAVLSGRVAHVSFDLTALAEAAAGDRELYGVKRFNNG